MISSVQSQALSFGMGCLPILSAREAYDKKIETNNQIATNAKVFNTPVPTPPTPISHQGNLGENLDITA